MSVNEVVKQSELYPDFLINEGVAQRMEKRIRPDGGSSITVTTGDQPVVRFNLPTSGLVNFAHLKFKFSAAVQGGTTPSIENGIWSLFQRVKIYMNGGSEIINCNNYNEFMSIMYQIGSASASNTSPFLGVDTQANRRTYASGRAYQISPLKKLAPDVLFPLPLLKGYCCVEFYPANPNLCIESSTAVTSYTLSNMVLIYDSIIPQQDYLDKLIGLANAGQLQYPFISWDYTSRSCTGTSNDINIPSSARSLRALYAVQRLSTAIGAQATNNKLSTWGFNTTTQYAFKLNGNSYPQDPIVVDSNGIEAYYQVLKTYFDSDDMDLWQDITGLSYSNYTNGSFVIGQQFDKAGVSDSLMAGQDMTNSTGVDVNLQCAATANNLLDVFLVKDVVAAVLPNGDMNVMY